MKSLDGKVVVVTGAGSGMGRALALLCAERGASLALADYNTETVEETAGIISSRGFPCIAHRVDVSDRTAVRGFAQTVIGHYGFVDVVFNNAGIIPMFERFERSTYEVMERIIAVNFWGVVYGSREFIPYLLQRPEAALVNTSSVSGILAYMGLSPYVASKFAVRGLTETLRMEYRKTNLKVIAVYPGAIATRIKENSPFYTDEEKRIARMQLEDKKTVKHLTSAEDAARKILAGMMAGKARIIIGKDAVMQDLMARFFPSSYAGFLYSALKHRLPE